MVHYEKEANWKPMNWSQIAHVHCDRFVTERSGHEYLVASKKFATEMQSQYRLCNQLFDWPSKVRVNDICGRMTIGLVWSQTVRAKLDSPKTLQLTFSHKYFILFFLVAIIGQLQSGCNYFFLKF